MRSYPPTAAGCSHPLFTECGKNYASDATFGPRTSTLQSEPRAGRAQYYFRDARCRV